MAYKVIILYRLYMPSYFLGTFTEYPYCSLILSKIHNLLLKDNYGNTELANQDSFSKFFKRHSGKAPQGFREISSKN